MHRLNFEELKAETLKLDWSSRLRLAQALLESLHHQTQPKPKVVDQPVAPSGLTSEDFGVMGLDETVPEASAKPPTLSVPEQPNLPVEKILPNAVPLGSGGSIAESFH